VEERRDVVRRGLIEVNDILCVVEWIKMRVGLWRYGDLVQLVKRRHVGDVTRRSTITVASTTTSARRLLALACLGGRGQAGGHGRSISCDIIFERPGIPGCDR